VVEELDHVLESSGGFRGTDRVRRALTWEEYVQSYGTRLEFKLGTRCWFLAGVY